jgi:putative effector of murein hydrolase LrgA (UPF0299 family)
MTPCYQRESGHVPLPSPVSSTWLLLLLLGFTTISPPASRPIARSLCAFLADPAVLDGPSVG